MLREETQSKIISLLKCIKNLKHELRIHSFQIPFQVLFSFLRLARKLLPKRKV